MTRKVTRIEGVRVLTSEMLGDGRARIVVQEAGPVRDLSLSYPPEGGAIVAFILTSDELKKLQDGLARSRVAANKQNEGDVE